MALNCSHRRVFPADTSENNLLSPISTGHFSRKDKMDPSYSPELNVGDIVDLLPSDPFEMDIQTTVTAITGWLEDLGDCGGYVRSNSRRTSQENHGVFAGLNLIWNNALKSHPCCSTDEQLNSSILSFPSSPWVYEKSGEALDAANTKDEYMEDREMDGSLRLGEKVDGAARFEEAPHDAFEYCLRYLGVKDLLSVERVCTFLRSKVRGDLLLRKNIHIDQPLNEKITDDILLELASRVDGTLQCLSLVECPKITDDGIKRVLETNPRLTKLFVPGCTRLTIEGILNNICTHNSNKDASGIKYLRIGGLYGVTDKHYEDLKSLLGTDDSKLKSCHKPHFYHRGNFYLPYDDDRAIDIEMCPSCEKFRLVYDCPSEGCRESKLCRACTLCIARCAQCGRCINDNEYEETFLLDLLCSNCFKSWNWYAENPS